MDTKWEGTSGCSRSQLHQLYRELGREIMWRVLGEEVGPIFRCDEICARLNELAQETDDKERRKVIRSLNSHVNQLNWENLISASGAHAEKLVAHCLDELDIDHVRFDNINLGLGDSSEEYDQIIITKKIVFIIETKWRQRRYYISSHGNLKNPGGGGNYNLMHRLDKKRHLLRCVLMRTFGKMGERIPIKKFLVFANTQACIVDKSKIIQWYFPGELVYRIEKTVEEFADCPNLPMKKIARAIKASARPVLAFPELDIAALRAELDYLFPETSCFIEDDPRPKGLGDVLAEALDAPKRALASFLCVS